MATVLLATSFVHSTNTLKNRAFTSEVRGLQAQKRLRVSCRQTFVSASGEGQRALASKDEVTVLQSPSTLQLVNTSLSDWIVNFLLKEDVHELQVPQAVGAPRFQLSEPVAEFEATSLHQRERRRSERTVVFTEEKARRLRKENRATQTFHDKWYHSAIASRLAIPE